MTGAIRYWTRPGTIRLPPWPDGLPFTRGDRRTVADVVLSVAILVATVVALVTPAVRSPSVDALVPVTAGLVNPTVLFVLIGLMVVMGLRDKMVFLVARSERFLPMLSNTPWMPRRAKRANVRNFPDDLRPSRNAALLAHVGGSTVEILLPPAGRDRHGDLPPAHHLDLPARRSARVERPVRLRHRLPVLGASCVAGFRDHRLLLPSAPRRHRRGAARLPGARQPATRPGVIRAVAAPVRRVLGTIVGFDLGDGHFHDEQLIEAIQERCGFEPGEFLVAWVESQPIHKDHQEYKVIDAARGVIERGTYRVGDSIAELPWLPDGPIALDVAWTRAATSALDTDGDADAAAPAPGSAAAVR